MTAEAARDVLSFGRFELHLTRRQLTADGAPIDLGARAFDLLRTLALRPGQVLTKAELFASAWPGVTVDENNLQVQVSALRKILGAGVIATVPGRGYQFTAELRAAQSAPDTSTAVVPAQTISPLIGRAQDLAELKRLVLEYPLVTIMGAGGVGKTTLAQTLARQLAPQFAKGMTIVEIATVVDPEQVPSVVASALGLKLRTGAIIPQLVSRLSGTQTLLVIDNCEHQVGVVSSLLQAMMADAPRMRVVVTSQVRLGLTVENVFPLGPLPPPLDETLYQVENSPAAMLFVARTKLGVREFELTNTNAAAISDICTRLDGLPLAIELAAARVPLLGVEGVRTRLDQRLKLLTGNARDIAARHQTLRAALEWSYGLLAPTEQFVFRQLGVFNGTFTFAAVQGVAVSAEIDEWTALDALAALIDKSLVAKRADEADAQLPRFILLETMREFATSKLTEHDEMNAAMARHAEFFEVFAFDLRARGIVEPGGGGKLGFVQPDMGNLRLALDWHRQHAVPMALRMAASLQWFWREQGHHREAVAQCIALLASDAARDPNSANDVALIKIGLCGLAFEQNDIALLSAMGEAAEAAWRELNDDRMIALSIAWRAAHDSLTNNLATAERLYLEAVQLFQKAGDRYRAAETLINAACCRSDLGDPEGALPLLHQALSVMRGLNIVWGLGLAHENLGEAECSLGHYDESREHHRQAIEHFRDRGHMVRAAHNLICVAYAECKLSVWSSAWGHLVEAVEIARGAGYMRSLAHAFTVAGDIAVTAGDAGRAAKLFGAADTIATAHKVAFIGKLETSRTASIATARTSLGDVAYLAAYTEGSMMSTAQVLDLIGDAAKKSVS